MKIEAKTERSDAEPWVPLVDEIVDAALSYPLRDEDGDELTGESQFFADVYELTQKHWPATVRPPGDEEPTLRDRVARWLYAHRSGPHGGSDYPWESLTWLGQEKWLQLADALLAAFPELTLCERVVDYKAELGEGDQT